MTPRLLTAVTLALTAGCSSMAEEGIDVNGSAGGPRGDGTVATEPRLPYPDPPYGTGVGGVIENFRFLGWWSPAAAAYDATQLGSVSLADFHDPTGTGDVKLFVITAGAVWCSACKTEFQDLRSGIVQEYKGRGVEFLGTLFEDNDSRPAQPKDLEGWAKKYEVEFPFVLDPALKLGAFFDIEATPMSMIVDAHTMEILIVETGWAQGIGEGTLWGHLDRYLAERQ